MVEEAGKWLRCSGEVCGDAMSDKHTCCNFVSPQEKCAPCEQVGGKCLDSTGECSSDFTTQPACVQEQGNFWCGEQDNIAMQFTITPMSFQDISGNGKVTEVEQAIDG